MINIVTSGRTAWTSKYAETGTYHDHPASLLGQESDLGLLPPLRSCRPQSRLCTQNLSKLFPPKTCPNLQHSTVLRTLCNKITFYLHATQHTYYTMYNYTCNTINIHTVQYCDTKLFYLVPSLCNPEHKRQVYLTLFPGRTNSYSKPLPSPSPI